MGIKVGLLGLGTVGAGTATILLSPQGRHPLLAEVELAGVGVRSLTKPREVNLPPEILTTDLAQIVRSPEIDIVIEVLGGIEPARSLVLEAIAHGKHIITANKALIARHGDEIYTAANHAGVYVMLEAAVAGGIPIIQTLKQTLGVNRIQTITGIINGTTNYILTRMREEGGDFGDILADAQKLGYAEADPTADVDGLDASDKISILASLGFGGRIKLEDVYCEGIRSITKTDIAYAEQLGFVIKLLAIASRDKAHPDQSPPRLSVRVHPTLIPQDHPLASINGVYNAVSVVGEPLGQVVFEGPGAGAGATASSVVADLLQVLAVLKTKAVWSQAGVPDTGDGSKISLLHPLLSCAHQEYCEISTMEELKTRFYTRFITSDQPGVIGKLGTIFGDHQVSIESIVQKDIYEKDTHEAAAEIVVVTHNVAEGNFRAAIEEIKQLPTVQSVSSMIRVLEP